MYLTDAEYLPGAKEKNTEITILRLTNSTQIVLNTDVLVYFATLKSQMCIVSTCFSMSKRRFL